LITKAPTQSPPPEWLVTGATFTSYYDVKGLWGTKIEPTPFAKVVCAENEGDACALARMLLSEARGYCVRIDTVQKVQDRFFYETEIDWDAPWWEQLDIVAFDTETGGINPASDPIIEMAFVHYNNKTKEFEAPTSYFVDPCGKPIHPKARSVNGIEDYMLDGAKKFGEIMVEVVKTFSSRTVLVAHNRGFDAGMFYHHINEWNDANPESKINLIPPLVCTMEMAVDTDIGQGMNNKLGHLAKILELEGDNSHRAGDDALLCGRLFFALARRNKALRSMSARKFMDYFDSRMRI
jgi:DNA polymerase III epsilon subunit-like protein